MQTANGGQAVTAGARGVERDGFEAAMFEAAMFEAEYLMNGHFAREIAYTAIWHPYSGSTGGWDGHSVLNGTETPYSLRRASVNHLWTPVDGFELKLEEELSKDKEVAHTRETVDVLVLDSEVFAQQVTSKRGDTTALRRG